MSARLASAIIDRQPILVALFRRAGDEFYYEYVNHAYRQTKPHAEMLGKRMHDVWPETADTVVPIFMNVYETGEPLIVKDAEFTLEPEPGVTVKGRYAFEVCALDVDGERYLLEVADDVSDVVDERETAGELATTLQALLDRMTDAVEDFDREWRFTFVNRQAEKLLQRPSHELIGKNVWEEFPGSERFRDKFEEAVEARQTVSFREHYEPFDMWFDVRAYPSESGVTVFFTNANEQVRVERERLEALETLREKDRAIREAYSDVIDAVTGGRLIIIGRDELDSEVIPSAGTAHALADASQLSDARELVAQEAQGVPGLNDIVLAFSEGATNMLKHAGGGEYRVCRDQRGIQLVLTDSGHGIDFRNLPKATLVSGFSTAQSLGMGFTLMMELTDRLLLCSDETGTTLVLEKDIELAETGAAKRS